MKMMVPKILVFALALAAGTMPGHAITGASQQGSPAAQSVLMLLHERGFCTANVVSPTVLITAAHCVYKIKNAAAYWEGAQPDSLISAKNMAIHPLYRPDAPKTRERSVDLALVQLERPLPVRFKPFAIDYEARIDIGTRFIISGFGLADEKNNKTAGTLRSAMLVTREPLSTLLIWAKDPDHRGTGGCTGDSGGPFLGEDGKLVGITVWSAGTGNKTCGDLTQALRLSAVRDFIEKTLATWSR